MEDQYHTISENSVGEGYYTEKRSKFLAFAHHVETVEDVKRIVSAYRKQYYDARHCCYAYMLGPEQKAFRANDDGEPSSTAGKPILGIGNVLYIFIIGLTILWCLWSGWKIRCQRREKKKETA